MILYLILIIVAICSLPSVTPQNHWLRYYFCNIVFFMCTLLISILTLPFMVCTLRKFPHKWVVVGNATVLNTLLGITWETRNKHKMEQEKHAVVVMNHQSIYDLLGISTVWKLFGNCAPVGKKEFLYYFPIGFTMWCLGLIFIDRADSKTAKKQLSEETSRIFSKYEKGKIAIYPEGTRNSKGKGFLPFKKGAFRLAIEQQVPILPFVYSPYHFINHGKKIFRKGKAIISFLDPIPTTGLKIEDTDALLQKTRSVMEEEFKKLCKEVESFR